MPQGCIKVLSRTLFVGGVTSSEPHLRSLFAPYGIVQTCIVNVDKRHAFVKMLYRKDAVVARTAMEEYKDGNNQLRVRGLKLIILDILIDHRPNGASALVLAIAATIRRVSV
jgi:hypothetical protein